MNREFKTVASGVDKGHPFLIRRVESALLGAYHLIYVDIPLDHPWAGIRDGEELPASVSVTFSEKHGDKWRLGCDTLGVDNYAAAVEICRNLVDDVDASYVF